MIAFQCRDVYIVAPIVVVVADCDPYSEHLGVKATAGGDVGEGAVLVVAIERVQGFAAPGDPVAAIQKNYVLPAIAVGVYECSPGPQRLRKEFLARLAGVVGEFDASLRRNIRHRNVNCRRGARGQRDHDRTHDAAHDGNSPTEFHFHSSILLRAVVTPGRSRADLVAAATRSGSDACDDGRLALSVG